MLRVWGAYIWRGLYIEGHIFGILWYDKRPALTKMIMSHCLSYMYSNNCLLLERKGNVPFDIQFTRGQTNIINILAPDYKVLTSALA